MMIYRCNSCGRESTGRRALCPDCRGEEFSASEMGSTDIIVSSRLAVTPAGFEENYVLALGQAGKVKVLFRLLEE